MSTPDSIKNALFTTNQRICGMVMFSDVSVCLFTGGGVPCHVTIIHDALDLTVQVPPSSPGSLCADYLSPMLVTSLTDPRGDIPDAFLNFMQFFRKFVLAPSPGGLAPPPTENPGSAVGHTVTITGDLFNMFTWGPTPEGTDMWWPKYIRLASGQYTSYWNVFLLFLLKVDFRSQLQYKDISTKICFVVWHLPWCLFISC